MSAAQFKSEVVNRTGRGLLPASMPIEALISFVREMALFTNGALDHDESVDLADLLIDYCEKLLSSKNCEYLEHFRQNRGELLPLLAEELDSIVRNELVSRLIGYPFNQVTLKDLFCDHFADGAGAHVEISPRPES